MQQIDNRFTEERLDEWLENHSGGLAQKEDGYTEEEWEELKGASGGDPCRVSEIIQGMVWREGVKAGESNLSWEEFETIRLPCGEIDFDKLKK
jgi:hypothetical protein